MFGVLVWLKSKDCICITNPDPKVVWLSGVMLAKDADLIEYHWFETEAGVPAGFTFRPPQFAFVPNDLRYAATGG